MTEEGSDPRVRLDIFMTVLNPVQLQTDELSSEGEGSMYRGRLHSSVAHCTLPLLVRSSPSHSLVDYKCITIFSRNQRLKKVPASRTASLKYICRGFGALSTTLLLGLCVAAKYAYATSPGPRVPVRYGGEEGKWTMSMIRSPGKIYRLR